MDAVERIIGIHRAPGTGLHRHFKRFEVQLAQGAFVDFRIDLCARKLLFVRHKMFHRRGYSLRLYTLDIGAAEFPRQERILAKILEVPAIEGRPVEIHSGGEENVYAARTAI